MVKKILIVVALLIFSVLGYASANVMFTYQEYVSFAKDLAEEKEYTDLNRLIYGSIMDSNYTYEKEFEDGTILRTYKEVSIFVEYDDEGNIETQYITEGLQLFFANIGEDFDFSDIGEVKPVYTIGETSYDYSGEADQHPYAPSYLKDFNVYSFSIGMNDYDDSYGSSYTSRFNNFEIYNTDEELLYTIDLSSLSSYDKQFTSSDSQIWNEYITRANEFFELSADEQSQELANEILELATENSETSNVIKSTISEQVYERSGYNTKMTITMVVIILLNLVVVYFQFIKGKNIMKNLRNAMNGNQQVESNTNKNSNTNTNNKANNNKKEVVEVESKEVVEETPSNDTTDEVK